MTLRVACAAALAWWCTTAQAAPPHSEEHALTAPGVAGEIMDLAVEHCRRGERKEALAMFEAMRQQLDPPPAILQLIRDMEATGCNPVIATSGAALRVQVGGGWDSNVSQGITARSLVLGSGDNVIELPLDQTYLPRSSAFSQATVDYSLVLPRFGTSLQVALAQRTNWSARDFDLRTASAAAAKEIELPVGSLRAQGEVAQVWLGNREYQHSESMLMQWLVSNAKGAWLGTFSSTAVQYITQPLQNATVWDLGLLREWQLTPSRSVHASLLLERDDAHSTRPGGDRLGFQLQLGAVMLTHGWRLRSQLGYAAWESKHVFAPGLLDVKRRNRLRQASLQAERPLWENASLSLEWRGRWAHDTVALYRYQAQMVSATLAFRF